MYEKLRKEKAAKAESEKEKQREAFQKDHTQGLKKMGDFSKLVLYPFVIM